jgi:capsular polysaccharide transport system permease protein
LIALETPPAETAAVVVAAKRASKLRRLRVLMSPLFFISVLLPTVLAGIYYGLIASDTYVSESRFVVRSPQRPQLTGLGAVLQSGAGGFARSQDDTYSVHDFILSRDALRELNQKLGIEKMYSSEAIDPFDRFRSLDWDNSFESFYKYYRKRVAIDYDSVSAISVLTVRAYSAEDARNVNALLLSMGERLVNQLNDRSRSDLVSVAQKEVTAAEDRAKDASVALLGFRTKQSVFDPDRQAAMQLQGVAKVQDELLATEAQLAQLRQVSPTNPQIPTLTSRAELLRRAIAEQNAKVSGGRTGSFTAQSSGYDRLQLDKVFAERQLAAALAALATARDEAQRQQLYLETIVQPNLPDSAIEPRRIRTVAMVFLLGLIVWGVLSLVVSSVREHTE